MKRYPENLKQRFEIEQLADDEYSILEQIGAKRGCIKARNMLDLHKVSSIVVHKYRTGKLGGLCLELSQEVEQEKIEAIEIEKKRAAKREARKNRRGRKI